MYDNVGPASTPGYGGRGSGIYTFRQADGGNGLVFAGQTDDPFFLDLRVFDLLYGANLSETGVDSLAGFNVHSIALRVPKASLRAASPIIGVWATASRPATTTRQADPKPPAAAFVQVSRLGMPLVNEVVIPVGQKDKWNGSRPAGRCAVPELRDRSRSAEAARGAVRPARAGDAAQRSRAGVPDRRAESEPAVRRASRARCCG